MNGRNRADPAAELREYGFGRRTALGLVRRCLGTSRSIGGTQTYPEPQLTGDTAREQCRP